MTTIDMTRPGTTPGVTHGTATNDLFELAREIRENPLALLLALYEEPGLVRRTVEHWPELRRTVSATLHDHVPQRGRPGHPQNRQSIVMQLYKYVKKTEPGRKQTYYYAAIADFSSQAFFANMIGKLSEHAVRNIIISARPDKRRLRKP